MGVSGLVVRNTTIITVMSIIRKQSPYYCARTGIRPDGTGGVGGKGRYEKVAIAN